MKTIRIRLLIAGLTVLLGTALAKAQTSADSATQSTPPAHAYAHKHGHGMYGQMGFFSRKLNLTDEQKAQMKTIMQKERPTMKPLFQQQHQVDLQLRQYVEGTFDAAKVQALAAQKAQIQAQFTVVQTRIHNEMYQVLTADQQSQLKQMEADREARMQQHTQQNTPPSPEQ
jgi:Spy/CpxP family protein refolding chaperone